MTDQEADRARWEAAKQARVDAVNAGHPTGGTWVAMVLTAGLLVGAFLAWKWDHTVWTWIFIGAAILMSFAIPKATHTDSPSA